MKFTTLLLGLAVIAAAMGTSACYTDTVDAISVFEVQLPVNLAFRWQNRSTPDTAVEEVDLLKYDAYLTNRDKIRNATPYQLAFWLESVEGTPSIETAVFTKIVLHLQFEGDSTLYHIATFENVKASEYFKTPHVYPVTDSSAAALARALTVSPKFRMIQEIQNPTTGRAFYREILSRIDLAVRLEVEL